MSGKTQTLYESIHHWLPHGALSSCNFDKVKGKSIVHSLLYTHKNLCIKDFFSLPKGHHQAVGTWEWHRDITMWLRFEEEKWWTSNCFPLHSIKVFIAKLHCEIITNMLRNTLFHLSNKLLLKDFILHLSYTNISPSLPWRKKKAYSFEIKLFHRLNSIFFYKILKNFKNLASNHSNRCKVTSHCGSDLHFTDD